MMSRWQFILLLVGGACTAALVVGMAGADHPRAADSRAADLVGRCVAIEPKRPAFAKEAMVPYVARLLAG